PASAKISAGGEIIHEVGAARMGNDPGASVVNRYCQAHDVKNLFLADAAPFVSNPDKNPTLTITALAWRTAEYLAEEMRKGNVSHAPRPSPRHRRRRPFRLSTCASRRPRSPGRWQAG